MPDTVYTVLPGMDAPPRPVPHSPYIPLPSHHPLNSIGINMYIEMMGGGGVGGEYGHGEGYGVSSGVSKALPPYRP